MTTKQVLLKFALQGVAKTPRGILTPKRVLFQATSAPAADWQPGRLAGPTTAAVAPRRLDSSNACPLGCCLNGCPLAFLLLTSGNGRYCGLAFVAEIGDGILDASHFLDAQTFGTALLLLHVRAACFSSRHDLGQPFLACVGTVWEMLLYASCSTEVCRFSVV